MTTPKLDQAREWARDNLEGGYFHGGDRAFAAARVIRSLPDQWIDAEKLREVVSKYEGNTFVGEIVQEFADLLPTPPLQTLADMSLEELKDYIGVKVTVDGWANPSMLVAVIGDEGAVLAHRLNKPWPFVEVRPLSDLAPVAALEQEAEDTPEPVQPRPEDVKPGEVWKVTVGGREFVGVRHGGGSSWPWTLARIDGETCREPADESVTLVSRMVPESKENA